MFSARFGLLLLAFSAILTNTAIASEPLRSELPGTWRTSVIRAKPQLSVLGRPDSTGSDVGRTRTRISIPQSPSPRPSDPKVHELTGLASFYWQGQQTASGEPFDKSAMTAAHKTLPFGTRVKVTHVGNGRSVIVRINDRGPFRPGRVIDLSHAAAEELAMTGRGLARVQLEVLEQAASSKPRTQ
jgi:rare lipoprotein A